MTSKAPGFPETIDIAKSQAKRLVKAIEPHKLSHSQALEVVAKMHGERSWGAMSAGYNDKPAAKSSYDLGLPHHSTGKPAPSRQMYGWTVGELERLVDLLRRHPKVQVSSEYRAAMDKIVADGQVMASGLDSLLDAVTKEMGDFAFAITGVRLIELFEIASQSYLYRPSETDESTMGFQGISIAGAAALLIKLERLGLDTHPEHLVSVVNKSSAGRGMLTKHELDCLWYRSEKAGAGRQRLTVQPYRGYEDEPAEMFVTATGHMCSVHRDKSGLIELLVVDPPKTGVSSSNLSHVPA